MSRDLIQQAYESLRFNRRRTALTMLGMAWGIATVVLLLAYGAGFERAIENIFSNFGTKLIRIWGGRTSMQAGGAKAGSEVRLKIEDLEHIQATVPLVKRISPRLNKQARLQRDNRNYQVEVVGAYPDMQQIWNLQIDMGRFFNEADRSSRARVVVIGPETRQKFFGGQI